MKTASVVIGANYGDEGKGLITDYLASKNKDSLVVRFNGGSQSGHTVQTPPVGLLPSQRHVFGHIGAGIFSGASTYLSEFFIANPITFNKELEVLKLNISDIPKVFINKYAMVTTPYDMMLNQILSKYYKSKNTCGVGINETIQRTLKSVYNPELRIIVEDLFNLSVLKRKLEYIKFNYIKQRVSELELDDSKISRDIDTFNRFTIDKFLEDVVNFRSNIELTDNKILNKFDNIIFEGGQGLLLDQDHENFPFVTHSHTGLKNINTISKCTNIEHFNVIYTTRGYLTRHGDGPFEDENNELLEHNPNIGDKTNITNQFQGNLKFGYFNLDLFINTVNKDWSTYSQNNYSKYIAITCLDQLEYYIRFKYNDQFETLSHDRFINKVMTILETREALLSSGPTRETIEEYKL